jgi:hypothetical protein
MIAIKETDWITVDYKKPETLPKIGNWYIVRCYGVIFFDSPEVILTIKNFESDEVNLAWNINAFVENYDEHVLVDLEKINWNLIDMNDLSTVPSDFEGQYLVKHVTNNIELLTLYGSEEMRTEGDRYAYYWERYHIDKPIETGDKYVLLKIE